jgi:hypothetical protein
VGVEVSYRLGLAERRATLIDLSSRGCRLLTRRGITRGKRIKVLIPEVLDVGEEAETLVVPARVIHVEGTESGGVECFRLGISFEKLDDDTRNALALIIEDRAQGPATLRREPRAADGDADGSSRAITVGDRRRQTRGAYSQTIPAFGERALRVLVGRDLSVSGMRVQPLPELWIGDRLQLAIYGEAGRAPMLIWGRVDRSDGDRGMVILFETLDRSAQAHLERLVASLPAVESLQDSEAEAMGTVLSEILLTDEIAS